jgi:hypothetical protein
MNFERGKDPKESMSIGLKEYAFQLVSLLANKMDLALETDAYPNNPEIIFSWRSPKNGSYMILSERESEYSISYDLGDINYGNASLGDIKEMLEERGIL